MTTEARSKLKDNLVIIATSLTIMVNMGLVLGGMNWISEVNSHLKRVNDQMSEITGQLKDLQVWRHSHELEIAPLKSQVQEHLNLDKAKRSKQ